MVHSKGRDRLEVTSYLPVYIYLKYYVKSVNDVK